MVGEILHGTAMRFRPRFAFWGYTPMFFERVCKGFVLNALRKIPKTGVCKPLDLGNLVRRQLRKELGATRT